ncbi:hypothetical protein QBC47DRAFT_455067 [Echria macrotheca]|uniref:NADH dehydrogenase [ubiquinone] 1 alpha subcomplex assembly factor 3 n=1 Tax=Echria macrotheca TaxID=438768 RepID=A0AAJ0B2T4_9PEZI|nr:hypothetical protein QBC47DRAFT_455067 [Echria macrotheca]
MTAPMRSRTMHRALQSIASPAQRIQPSSVRPSLATSSTPRLIATTTSPAPSRSIHTSPLSSSSETNRQSRLTSRPPRSLSSQPVEKTHHDQEKKEPSNLESLDVFAGTPIPSTAVNTCFEDGFALNSGVRILDGAGALLVAGEAFVWRPWDVSSSNKTILNAKGQVEISEEGFGVLGLVWPRPDLLILGVGKEMRPLSPATRRVISGLGIRVEVLDTRNAAAQFNLLATERGVYDVAAALVPMGWKEGIGAGAG